MENISHLIFFWRKCKKAGRSGEYGIGKHSTIFTFLSFHANGMMAKLLFSLIKKLSKYLIDNRID